MWNDTDWQAFTAAVAPHGWAPYVENGSARAYSGCLTHPSMPGGVVRVESHAGKLVTDYATASDGTSRITVGDDWDRAAKRWADGPGAVRLARWTAARMAEAVRADRAVEANRRAHALADHARRAGVASPYVRDTGVYGSKAATVDMGTVRATIHPGVRGLTIDAHTYGNDPRAVAADLLILADFIDAEGK